MSQSPCDNRCRHWHLWSLAAAPQKKGTNAPSERGQKDQSKEETKPDARKEGFLRRRAGGQTKARQLMSVVGARGQERRQVAVLCIICRRREGEGEEGRGGEGTCKGGRRPEPGPDDSLPLATRTEEESRRDVMSDAFIRRKTGDATISLSRWVGSVSDTMLACSAPIIRPRSQEPGAARAKGERGRGAPGTGQQASGGRRQQPASMRSASGWHNTPEMPGHTHQLDNRARNLRVLGQLSCRALAADGCSTR